MEPLHPLECKINNELTAIDRHAKVLVGLSGGADSVALLTLLTRVGIACFAAHCNFRLRGEEAVRDNTFARTMAAQLNVPFIETSFDTKAYCRQHKVSIETGCRELRYAWFKTQCERLGAQYIAVGHNADDNVETFLMNMIRGTGIAGLTAIPATNGDIIRPLLHITRTEIEAYLTDNSLSFVVDSSNLEEIYRRNKIRHSVIPLLTEINPSVTETIGRNIETLIEIKRVYDTSIAQQKELVCQQRGNELLIDISLLNRQPAPRALLYELLRSRGVTHTALDAIEALKEKQAGRQFNTDDYSVVRYDRYLVVTAPIPRLEKEEFLIESIEDFAHLPISITASLHSYDSDFILHKEPKTASFDAHLLSYPLTLRRWHDGDSFRPFGMQGKQKLSNYFSTHKFTPTQKQEAWVLCYKSSIIWLVGHRVAQTAPLTMFTQEVLVLVTE